MTTNDGVTQRRVNKAADTNGKRGDAPHTNGKHHASKGNGHTNGHHTNGNGKHTEVAKVEVLGEHERGWR